MALLDAAIGGVTTLGSTIFGQLAAAQEKKRQREFEARQQAIAQKQKGAETLNTGTTNALQALMANYTGLLGK